MKIGIDGRSLKTSRAIFRYTKNILNNLSLIDKDNEYFLFVEGGEELANLNYLNLSLNWRLVKAPTKIVFRDHFFFYDFLKRFSLDLFFHPDNTEFLNCLPRSVVTIHDLIPYRFPELSLSANPLKRLRQNLYLNLQKRALNNSSRFVITVSENSKNDIIGFLGISSDKIAVIPEAVEPNFRPSSQNEILEVKNKYRIEGEYLFCHSSFSAYKNLIRLIDAFALIARDFPNLQMVFGGHVSDSDWQGKNYYRRLVSKITSFGLSNKVIFTDFVPEEILPALYSGAKIFVYPSLYEGFGIPILEAQACDLPVVTSRTSSLPEVSGDSALLADPLDMADIAEKISSFLRNENLRLNYVGRGRENVKRFSWQKSARETIEVFRKVYEAKV